MRSIIKFGLFMLLLATLCHGQSTAVTLTVSDADAQVWFNGTWSVQLTSPVGVPCCRYVISGTSTIVPNQQQNGTLDPVLGNASMTLTPNTSIAPSGTQWTFQVCPLATSPCFTQSITISGASQTVALAPPAIRVSLRNPQFVVTVYQDIEAVNGSLGSQYFNLTTNTVRFCSVLSGGNCTFSNVGAPPGTTGQFVFYTSPTSIGPDPNCDDGLTNPGQVTCSNTINIPQANFTGTGAIVMSGVGGVMPTLGAGNGGFGVFTGGFPQCNANNAWFFCTVTSVNGTAFPVNKLNFNNTTPAAPTNGINIQCTNDVNGNLSCAIVGDGNSAHAFCGNGVFAVCTTAGATALSGLTAATGANTINNGNNVQTWNFSGTSANTCLFCWGENVASTAGTYYTQIATLAGSVLTPLNVTASLTGSQALSTVVINPTWNTTGVVPGALIVNPTNTASGAGSLIATFQVSNVHQIDFDKVGDIFVANAVGGTTNTTSLSVCGGSAANNCGPPSVNGVVGGLILQGADNGNTGTGTKAGLGALRGGFLTAATPAAAALEGPVQVAIGGTKGTAIAAVGDVLCIGAAAAANVFTDCSHTGPAVNIIGIAVSTTNPIGIVMYGTAPVSLDNTAVIGDTVCMGTTTDGKAHDNGTTACALGTSIGVVLQTVGAIQSLTGTGPGSVTLSTSLPQVALHISQ